MPKPQPAPGDRKRKIMRAWTSLLVFTTSPVFRELPFSADADEAFSVIARQTPFDVVRRVCMSVRAVCLPGMHGQRAVAAQYVHFVRDCL